MESLQHIGFNDWFQARIEPDKLALHEIARVVSVHKDSYMITKGHGDVFAELTGKLAYTADSAADLPTTGDWVYVDFYDDDTHAIIHRSRGSSLTNYISINNLKGQIPLIFLHAKH